LGTAGALTNNNDAAVTFGGDADRIDLDHTLLDGINDLSAVFWIKTTRTGSQAVISGAQAGNSHEFLIYFDYDRRVSFYTGENSESYVSWNIDSIADDEWHMVAVTRDGTNDAAELYIDGASQGIRATALNPLAVDEGGLVIGQYQTAVGTYQAYRELVGSLDEPALFHSVLTAERIQAIYARGTEGPLYTEGPDNFEVRHNTIQGNLVGVSFLAQADGRLSDNEIFSPNVGLRIAADFSGHVQDNDIHGAATGLYYEAAAAVGGNRIFDNDIGVVAAVAGDTEGFGFVGTTEPNEIFGNATGVVLDGQMQNQTIRDNTGVGVTGSGVLGGNDLEHANRIEGHSVGVADFEGTIQFNRISGNTTGVMAVGGQKILNNLIYRNDANGVLVDGVQDVRIIQNTLYAATGDNIRIENYAANVEVRSNILWADSGYDIYVANNSQTGFYSDYNTLWSEGDGRLVYWTKGFSDVLDWQADVGRFDLHSIGSTVIDPDWAAARDAAVDAYWAQPRFLDDARGDYRVFELTGGQGFSSPSIAAADPRTDQGVWVYAGNIEDNPGINLLDNPDFENGLTGWTANNGAGVESGSPNAFEGSDYFAAGNIEEGFAEQTVDLSTAGYTPLQLDSQSLQVVFGGRIRSIAETALDRGRIELTFLDGSDAVIDQVTTASINPTDRWDLVGDRVQIPIGTQRLVFRFVADRESGSSNDSYLDNAFLYIVTEQDVLNQGAYGGTAGDVYSANPHLALRSPDLYVDWVFDRQHIIEWDSYGNTANSPVRIDLYQDSPDGPALIATLEDEIPDTGEYLWIPSIHPATHDLLDFGIHGLRIQISLSEDSRILDRSTEPFSLPEAGINFYVDDAANLNDEYTPDAVGSNRHTGKAPDAPKPNPVNILRVYDLDDPVSGGFLNVDTGAYALIDPVTVSGSIDLGFGLEEDLPSGVRRIRIWMLFLPRRFPTSGRRPWWISWTPISCRSAI